jgi:hypothetical protein
MWQYRVRGVLGEQFLNCILRESARRMHSASDKERPLLALFGRGALVVDPAVSRPWIYQVFITLLPLAVLPI